MIQESGIRKKNRIDAICEHPVWQESVRKIRELEQNRKFCRHTVEHFMDVARLAYIENLEQNTGISMELSYASALLHDIGRHLQYEKNIPHDEAGVLLAGEILKDCGFSESEKKEILGAIGGHRDSETKSRQDLAGLIYRADKKSRMCMFCEAEPECNWSEGKKNMQITR